MGLVEAPKRDEVWLIALDPTRGSEIQKTRPCVVVSPDEMNRHLRTIIIAPMTSAVRRYPTRVPIVHGGKTGEVVLDQLRAVDRSRLLKKIGIATQKTAEAISEVLVEMFARR
jgi:mRNA interferase MazF